MNRKFTRQIFVYPKFILRFTLAHFLQTKFFHSYTVTLVSL